MEKVDGRRGSSAVAVVVLVTFLGGGSPLPASDSVVVFNEIQYHPADDTTPEWIELHNQMEVNVDISDWQLTGGVFYRFDVGTVISGGGFVVVTADPRALEAATGFADALGPFEGRLGNGGEDLELFNNSARLMNSVRYRDDGDWPVAPDGAGVSLAKVDPDTASAPAVNWMSSVTVGGTPGAHNFPDMANADVPALAFNEIRLEEAGSFVELVNYGDADVALDQVRLVSSQDLTVEQSLGAGTLAPGGFLVLAAAEITVAMAAGDALFLYGADRQRVLAAARVADGVRGRSPDGTGPWWFPAATTPGEPNQFAFQDDIVINEILYHAPPVLERSGEFTFESVFPVDSSWKFEQSGADLGTAWREPDFDDGAWLSGKSAFFVTTSAVVQPQNTPLEIGQVGYYFRTTFHFDGDLANPELFIRPLFDDGIVIYLNGAEIFRRNMPEGPIERSTLAARGVVNAFPIDPVLISTDTLQLGDNVLAVEVHQSRANSRDVAFGMSIVRRVELSVPVDFLDSPEAWVELHNQGDAAVDLGGWRFADGIDFTFESGTTVEPRGFLVVAGDSQALRARYPDISIVGDFLGRLSRRGERLLLVDSNGNPADVVEYYDRGDWPRFADGLSASLELRDPRADNSNAASWAASDEREDAVWETFSFTDVGTSQVAPANWSELIFGLLGPGEVLIDDVSVIQEPEGEALELIQDSGFDRGAETWRFLGTHERSQVIADPDEPGNQVLRLVATGPTEHMHNHAETTLTERLSTRRIYTVSFRVRWVAGSRQLHSRLYFNRLPHTNILGGARDAIGTPGATNSTRTEDLGPNLDDLAHAPLFPERGRNVTVSLVALDPDGIQACTLWYSVGGGEWQETPMTLEAGRYQGVVTAPDRAGGRVQFYVAASDTLGATAFLPPNGPESGALFQVRDVAAQPDRVNNLRIIMAPLDAERLVELTNRMSDARQPATLIYREREVFYDIGVRLRGSERGRPDDNRTGFSIAFRPDQPFRGVQRTIAIDRSGGWRFGRAHGHDEILIKHMANHAGGIPGMYDDLIHIVAPVPKFTGSALLLMTRFGRNFLESQFQNGADGTVYTYELIYSPNSTVDGNAESLKLPLPDSVVGTDHRDLGDDKEQYRWLYLIENNRLRDDYSSLMEFTKTLGMTGPELDTRSQAVIDIDQWMRVFAFYSLVGVGDTYMNGNFHNNQYYVRPEDNRVLIFPWDMDFAFTSPANASLFGSDNFRKVILIPRNQRVLLRHFRDITDTTYRRDYMDSWVEHYGALAGEDYSEITTYIGQRRASVRPRLPIDVEFRIITNEGADFTTEEASVVIDGEGNLDIDTVVPVVGGGEPPRWIASSRWRYEVPLEPGENTLSFLAVNPAGDIIGQVGLTVTRETIPMVPFRRGDANTDSRVNLLDAIDVLDFLFRERALECLDAGDVNDDGTVQLDDAVGLLQFLFRDGGAPAAPYPEAGEDVTEDELDCRGEV
jgi:hypothetical protein